MRVRFGLPLLLTGCTFLLSLITPSPLPGVPAGDGDDSFQPPWNRLEFLGEIRLLSGLTYRGTEVGGLSALAWDPTAVDGTGRTTFWALSDDKGTTDWRGSPRLYRLQVSYPGIAVDQGTAFVSDVVPLLDRQAQPLAPGSVDPEGLVLAPDGHFWISSEGDAEEGVDPRLWQLRPDGVEVRSLALPAAYGTGDETRGPRDNKALESLTLSPGWSLFTATENALVQDGPEATLETGSPSRILRFDPATGEVTGEFLYPTEPVVDPPTEADGLTVNGLVELLAVDEHRLLALERSYSLGRSNSIRLYLVDLRRADDILGRHSLADPPDAPFPRPVGKRLLADLSDLEREGLLAPLDNVEGMTWGPSLADGRRTLWLVSDNNFNPEQVNQLLAFALADHAPPIAEIQGAGHRSPLAGQWLEGVEGVVTHVLPAEDGEDADGDGPAEHRFTIQSLAGDGDPATSEGLWVTAEAALLPAELTPGDRLSLAGRVVEAGRSDDLPVTTLEATRVVRTATNQALPGPVVVGDNGLRPPTVVVDDDRFEHFDPAVDGADFWETLEGMRLRLTAPRVVGPSWRDGSVVVTAGNAQPRGRRGALVLAAGDANPERLFVDPPPGVAGDLLPALAVGARFTGPLEGVLGFRSGLYRLSPTAPWPPAETGDAASWTSPLAGNDEAPGDDLTVATWNVWNLGPDDGEERFARAARRIVDDLGSPAILALQEMQDADGAANSGTVDGEPTFKALAAAVEAAGGPRYVFRQIDPLDGLEGGQPGGNIRVGFLLDPARVTPVDRGDPDPLLPVQVLAGPDGAPRLEPSPGRLAPAHPAFAGDRQLDFGRSRRPLALEVTVQAADDAPPQRLFLLANHFNSKGGDDGYFTSRQPPRRPSEHQRSHQAEQVARWVQQIRTLDPQAHVIVLGDLNDHEFRPPLAVLEAAGLVNLIHRVPLEERYTFNFKGNAQVLDHVLVTPELASEARIDIVHGDSDLPYHLRTSDHDPVLVRLPLSP